jgi:hypothetical protein
MIARDPVPRPIDFHDELKLPAEAIEQTAAGTRPGATGEFGLRQIERYHNADGQVCCLLEARMRRRSASITRRWASPVATGTR